MCAFRTRRLDGASAPLSVFHNLPNNMGSLPLHMFSFTWELCVVLLDVVGVISFLIILFIYF
jgi:hypothetical protein